jgi:phosphoribosylaminoimidazolecarboxamide formyltransferase/IMP cyclohydrolase
LSGTVSLKTRKELAGKVFNLTSAYDAAISRFLLEDMFPKYLSTSYKKVFDLRYGENPHQKAAYYVSTDTCGAMKDFKQLNGKELSFNNLRDMDIAWKIANEFQEITVCAVKHCTPCGVANGISVFQAWQEAFACDSISIFGGIIASNTIIDEETAHDMTKTFLEIVIAPDYTEQAISIFKKKKNLRIIKATIGIQDTTELFSVDGGLLIQERDHQFSTEFETMTKRIPSSDEMRQLLFAQKVVKHVKSNAIVVAKDCKAIGIGTGQVNRIWAAKEAIERAVDGVVLASDAFFPFPDVIEECAKAGIKAIIQPGGSVNDAASIDACNKHDISMVFTKMRHFKH